MGIRMGIEDLIYAELIEGFEKGIDFEQVYEKYKRQKSAFYRAASRAFAHIVAKSKGAINEARSQLNRLNSQLSERRGQLSELEGIEEDIARSRKELAEVRGELQQTKATLEEAKGQLDELSKMASQRGLTPVEALDTVKKIKDLRKHISELKRHANELEGGVGNLRAEEKKFENLIENSKKAYGREVGEYVQLTNKIDKAWAELENVSKTLGEFSKEVKGLKPERDSLSQQVASQRKELSDLKRAKEDEVKGAEERIKETQRVETEKAERRIREAEGVEKGLLREVELLEKMVGIKTPDDGQPISDRVRAIIKRCEEKKREKDLADLGCVTLEMKRKDLSKAVENLEQKERGLRGKVRELESKVRRAESRLRGSRFDFLRAPAEVFKSIEEVIPK